VILATGTRQRRLSVPGEKEFIMRGLCYSALSYAPLFIDRKTVVIGDGDLALRSAAELATVASHVHLVDPAGTRSTPPWPEAAAGKECHRPGRLLPSEVKGNGFATPSSS